jgi:hypothetical protein
VPFLIAVLSLAITITLLASGCPAGDSVIYLAAFSSGVGFGFLSLMILHYQPQNRIGWLAAVVGVTFPAVPWTGVYAACNLPGAAYISWISYILPWFVLGCLFLALPLLFPDGHFLSAGWRHFAAVAFGLLALLGFLIATLPGPMQYNGMGSLYPYDNPLALPLLPRTAGPILGNAMFLFLVGPPLAAILSYVQRWRRSLGEVRLQLKWFAFFLATAVSSYVIFEFYSRYVNLAILDVLHGWLYRLVLLLVFSGFPLTVGIAVLKYRLYDIDVIIRRTLVYGVLTGLLALVYFSSVVLLQTLFQALSGQQSPLVVVISTLLIAALFAPLRQRVQGAIDRRFFRNKYDTQQVLDQFARAVRDETNLEQLESLLLDAVDSTVQPRLLNLWLKPTFSAGRPALVPGAGRRAERNSQSEFRDT